MLWIVISSFHIRIVIHFPHAQKKGKLIDENKHLVLKAVHPSPLSAYRGFFGCRHFSQANAYLRKNGHMEIDWQIADN